MTEMEETIRSAPSHVAVPPETETDPRISDAVENTHYLSQVFRDNKQIKGSIGGIVKVSSCRDKDQTPESSTLSPPSPPASLRG